MARGIMTHGKLKTFFTRGFLGGFFRPILYSEIDKINLEFVKVITMTIDHIDAKVHQKNKMALQIWFSMAPLEYFDLLFLPDKNNKVLIPMLEKAEINNGRECAYLTQGFLLYQLEQLIKNSLEYRNETKLTIKNVEEVCDLIFGEDNKTRKYCDNFKQIFNTNQTDPRDQPIIFVYEATKLFIPDKKRQRLAIQGWDNDLMGKFKFISVFVDFIVRQKDNSLKMLE